MGGARILCVVAAPRPCETRSLNAILAPPGVDAAHAVDAVGAVGREGGGGRAVKGGDSNDTKNHAGVGTGGGLAPRALRRASFQTHPL